ncbi:MAG: ABC transporter ATP-binding protein [bacterium]|jgi:peptide/nickel transport system ATP-binding protein|nr:ABC transporter ATP-binding protein [bacterium]
MSSDRGTETLLKVDNLEVHFAMRSSPLARLVGGASGVVKAVDGVDLAIQRGEVLGIIGESGSGKTTLGRAVMRLVKPTGGSIRFDSTDLTGLSAREFRQRQRQIQMIFQDPYAALNPAMTIATAIGHGLAIQQPQLSRADRQERALRAMERVGLTPTDQFAGKYPADLSGGQKQRAVIARAIALDPQLLVADEPVSMLDMSVRSKILQLLIGLKRDMSLTLLYITHDLASAKLLCDRIAIMYLGRIVEIGTVEQIFDEPRHPYTRALLAAIPDPDPERQMPRDLPRGEVPDAASPPLGCAFHPRCPVAIDRCGWESRDLATTLDTYWAGTGPDQYRSDQELFADAGVLTRPSTQVRINAAHGHRGADLRDLLDRAAAATPEDPVWSGISEVVAEYQAVTVTFHDGEDPRLRATSTSQAACLLYPEAPGDAPLASVESTEPSSSSKGA